MKVRINIIPRKAFVPYLKRNARWACLVVHRRGGKSFVCIQDLIARACTHRRPGPPLRYAYIAPTRDQAKDIAWAYLVKYASKIPAIEINKADLVVGIPEKWSIRLYSGDNYERMRGLYFDGAVMDESADIDPRAWDEVIRPLLIDYKGWAVWIGTPKGKNSFYHVAERAKKNEDGRWFYLMLRASESGIIDDEELSEMKATMPEEIYAQELECDFSVALQGAIYAKYVARLRSRGQITTVPCDGSIPCWTFWDLGSPRNTAVWTVQFESNRIRVLHCDTAKDWGTAERVAIMQGRGYAYAGHIIPHDGAAMQKGGLTYEQELEKAGLKNVITLPRTANPNARIHRITSLLPSMWFDENGCELGIQAMESYRRTWDAKKNMFSDIPYHDWSSHPCDALGYLAEGIEAGIVQYGGIKKTGKVISPIPTKAGYVGTKNYFGDGADDDDEKPIVISALG